MTRLLELMTLPKRSKVCLECGEKISCECTHSFLEKDFPEPVRLDFCTRCSEKKKGEKLCIYWQSLVQKDQKEEKNTYEDSIELFREYHTGSTEEAKKNAYFLALYLIRKRVFQQKRAKNGQLLVLFIATGELFSIEITSLFDEEEMLRLLLKKQ